MSNEPEKMKQKIEEVEARRAKLKAGGGLSEIEKQHSKGKLTARERIDTLLDSGTFFEIDLWRSQRKTGFDIDKKELPGDGVVTGLGEMSGRPVFVYSQDFTVLAGTMASVHAKKVIKAMEEALRMRVPIIGIIDSGGVRIQDNVTADLQDTYIRMFYHHTILSGVVPQISLMMGPCAAGASYSPILTDFCFMVKDTSHMYIASPALIKAVTFKDTTEEEIGSARMHAEVSGCSDLTAENDQDCLQKAKDLMSFLPLNNEENPPIRKTNDDPNRRDEELLSIVPTNLKQPYDVRKVIKIIADDHYLFEIKKDYAKNMVTCFIRLGGHSVGVIANNPMFLGGSIDINASDKAARFIRFCDAFNIPLLFLADNPAYLPGVDQERGGIIRHGAKVLFAASEATVSKMTVVLRKNYGGGVSAMCPRPMGSNLMLAWPIAELGVMGSEGAVSIVYKNELKAAKNPEELFQKRLKEYNESVGKFPFQAAMNGWLDDIIDPRDTRSVLIKAFKWFAGKKEERPWKKHGNIPL